MIKKVHILFLIMIPMSIFLSFSPFPFSSHSLNVNKDCMACHIDPNLTTEEGKSLFLDIDSFQLSVHGEEGFSCVDCHSDLRDLDDFPHPKKLAYVSCEECHEKAAEEIKVSIHNLAKTKDGQSIGCTDCHGSHDTRRVQNFLSRVSRKEIIGTCGRCHSGMEGDYLEGVHGKDYVKGIKDVPVCTDCHNGHDIISPQDLSSPLYTTKVAEVCSRCHENETLARQYGFLMARLKTYSKSFHGIASKFGETRVANCASCHGFHDIRPSTDPKSSVHPDNLPQTCEKCHPGAGKNFARGKIHVVSKKVSNKWAYFIKMFYIILIAGIILVFIIFITVDLFHRLTHRKHKSMTTEEKFFFRSKVGPDGLGLIRDDEVFMRMNLAERMQHFILIAVFSILIVTGLPLILYEIKFLEWIFSADKSFYIRGILHRMAAVVLILNLIWHIIYTIFSVRGRNNFREMTLKFNDLRDAFELFWHNMGLTRFLNNRGLFKDFFNTHPYWLFTRPPRFGRYNFTEKFEYWTVAWGSIVMIVSGFFRWNVELSLSLFPLWIHDIFIIVHSYEAILAFLVVIIWHLYNVHLNPEVFPMSKIWLNGKITGKELRNLHPLEYQKILEEKKKALDPRPKE